MVSASIKIDTSEVKALFNNINNFLLNPPWNIVQNDVQQSIDNNFNAQGRPDKWTPRKVDRPWPILKKSGALKKSVYTASSGPNLTLGSNGLLYNAVHQFGYSKQNIPARPYLMLQEEDEELIANKFDDAINKL